MLHTKRSYPTKSTNSIKMVANFHVHSSGSKFKNRYIFIVHYFIFTIRTQKSLSHTIFTHSFIFLPFNRFIHSHSHTTIFSLFFGCICFIAFLLCFFSLLLLLIFIQLDGIFLQSRYCK